jgi:hypothetical protein
METLIRILILLFTMFFYFVLATPVTVTGPNGQPEPTMTVQTVIESADALIMESFPVQIALNVRGYQPDGCDYPVEVTQTREGNTVNVTIFRTMPMAVLCTMQLVPYEDTIQLEGGFEPGTYTINVNGVTIEVTV